MVYLIYGQDRFILERTVTKEVKTILGTQDALNFVKFDGRDHSFTDIMTEVDYLPLGVTNKVVLADFIDYFDKKTSLTKNEEKEFISFIKDQRKDVILLLIVRDVVNRKHPLISIIEQFGRIIEIKPVTNEEWPTIIKTMFNRASKSIDEDAIKLLIEYTQGNTLTVYNEVEKLMLYKNQITRDDVFTLVARPFEESVFELTNALIGNDKSLALKIYRDFQVNNLEPLILVSTLANQFRLYATVFLIADKKLSKDEIAQELGINPYRVQLALRMRQKLSLEEVYEVLDQLHSLDYMIKSGQVDRYYAFELFLINY